MFNWRSRSLGADKGHHMQTDHDQTSRALLDAAHRLLADHGSEALTVRRIATEAGMSTMNVYSRFGGKDGVIDELFIDGFERPDPELVLTTTHLYRSSGLPWRV